MSVKHAKNPRATKLGEKINTQLKSMGNLNGIKQSYSRPSTSLQKWSDEYKLKYKST